jgi:hypothetical protein
MVPRVLAVLIVVIAVVLGGSFMLSGGPTEIVNRVRIEKPPHVVFEYISDMRNELKWNPDVMYMTKTNEGPIAEGTTFRAKWHLSDTLDVTVVRFAPPYELTFQNGGEIQVTLAIQLHPVDSATELEAKFIANPNGFARAMFPIIKSAKAKQEKENMTNLKKAIELLDNEQ